jgi:GR25 family glycosyltransferase involved in LPS biosynthesis
MKNINESLLNSYDRVIEKSYIIRMKENEESNKLALRCYESCLFNGMNARFWEAFDGTNGKDIIVPSNLNDQWFVHWLKKVNDKLSTSQLACFLSHFSLWAHCITIDKPIIILEHDAVVLKSLHYHKYYNTIQFLGCFEQKEGSLAVSSIPPHGTIYNGHWRFICRAHAYAIDPAVAKNLISYVLREGITKTLDVIMRCDIFSIIQDDLYAYDERGISTIQEKEDYSIDF